MDLGIQGRIIMVDKNFIKRGSSIDAILRGLMFLLLAASCNSSPKAPRVESPVSRDLNAEPKSLFNGQDLSGWVGDTEVWKVENAQLVGSSLDRTLEDAVWITTEEEFEDFELTLKVKLIGDQNKNSGVYYRGQWDEEFVVGYEFDVGGWGDDNKNFWGELHDPYRREDLVVGLAQSVIDTIYKEEDWNEVRVRVEGNHIQHWLNGRQTVDWKEMDTSMQRKGFIAFQMHDASNFKVFYKDISLVEL